MNLSPENADIVREQSFYLPVLASVFSLSGVSLIAPALPSIASGLPLTEQNIGLLITAFTLPAVLVLPLSGFLSDTLGRNRVMGVGCIILGGAGFLTGLAEAVRTILLLRALQGVGYALVMPVTVALLADVYDAEKETGAQGFRVALNRAGKIGWLVLGGALAGIGWRYVFLAYTALLPLGIWIYQALPADAPDAKPPRTYFNQLVAAVDEKPMAMFLSIGFVRMFLKYTVITFLPLLLTSRYSLTSTQTGMVMGVIGVGGILTAAYAGRMESRFRKTSTIFVAFLLIGLGVGGIGLAETLPAVLVLTFLIGGADSLISPLHKSLLTRNVDQGRRTGLVAANSMGQNLGKTLAPVVMGLFLIGGTTALFIITGVTAVASGSGYFLLRRVVLSHTENWHHPTEL